MLSLLLSLKTFAARIPGIAWAVLIVAAVLGISAAFVYHAGKRKGEVEVHTLALHDSVMHVTAAVIVAEKKSDSTVRIATAARTSAARTRPTVRAAIVAELADRPAVQSLVTEQLDADSLTITVQAATIDTLLAERVLRVERDTLVDHELVLKPPATGGASTAARVTKDVVAVVVVVGVVRWVASLLLHR